jgi:hypothetical protein
MRRAFSPGGQCPSLFFSSLQPCFGVLHLKHICRSNEAASQHPRRRSAMNALMNLNHSAQRAVCLFFAAVIVATSLSMGVVGTHVAYDNAVSMAAK